MSTDKRTDTFYCDFCGKSQHEVTEMIRGPSVEICNECIVLCQQRVDEVGAARLRATAAGGETDRLEHDAAQQTAEGEHGTG